MKYEYDRAFAPFVFSDGLPMERDALPDARWIRKVVTSQLRGAIATGYSQLRSRLPEGVRHGPPGRALNAVFRRVVPELPGRLPTTGDAEFAYRRFAGINPVTVRRARGMDDVPPRLRLADADFAALVGRGETLAGRLARGDILVQTYDELRGMKPSDLQPGRFVAQGSALFCYAPELDAPFEVVPLAIECPVGRADGVTGVFTPRDGARWDAAKRLIDVADVHVAELCVHLARGHSMLAPFAIAMRRRLSKAHPLREFLLAHLRFNVFVDLFAWRQGVKETDGVLISTLAGRAEWSHAVAKTHHVGRAFRDLAFEADLRARGLDDHPVDYPYRDDGRLLYAAIGEWVRRWTGWAYPSDEAVRADAELRAFVADAESPEGGNLPGILEGDEVGSRDELAALLTELLFWAGPFHCMAHCSIAAHLQAVAENPAFLATNPVAARGGDAREATGPAREKGQFGRVYSTFARYDRLGDYGRFPLGRRPELQSALADYRRALDAVEAAIAARNATRFAPFIHLEPSRLTNGVTI